MEQAKQTTAKRLAALREAMAAEGAQWYLMVTADPHGSEYINDYYKERAYFSGFTGSNGDLLVGMDTALLWTDGRYFVQAQQELDESVVTLMREGEEGVPTMEAYLEAHVSDGDLLLADGRLISAELGQRLRRTLRARGARMMIGRNLTLDLWRCESSDAEEDTTHPDDAERSTVTAACIDTPRPADNAEAIRILPRQLYEEDFETKLAAVRDAMRAQGAAAYVLTKLDDQMWLYNIRGNDIAYNPVAYAYSIITLEDVTVYVKDQALRGAFCDYGWAEGFAVRGYDEFYEDLRAMELPGPVLLDLENVNYLTLRILQQEGYQIIDAQNPTEALKAVKKGRELERIREVYLRDSVILTRFLRYIKENVGKTSISEVDAQERLDAMRQRSEGCNDLSFTTISAYGANAAMMHYEATEEKHSDLKPKGFYLVDSGGQYDGGTTDVTRTLALGEVTEEMRAHFTYTTVGMLALQNAVFLKGCTGRNLDVLAREALWTRGIDYKCGTGHGVGYMLNVHEGPQGIRPKKRGIREEAALEPGMLISDEPGVYIAGSHGIRLENILLVTEKETNGDGTFLAFEPLTWVPIDTDGIDVALLQPRERQWINDYHAQVREKLLPYLEDEDAAWLMRATEAV